MTHQELITLEGTVAHLTETQAIQRLDYIGGLLDDPSAHPTGGRQEQLNFDDILGDAPDAQLPPPQNITQHEIFNSTIALQHEHDLLRERLALIDGLYPLYSLDDGASVEIETGREATHLDLTVMDKPIRGELVGIYETMEEAERAAENQIQGEFGDATPLIINHSTNYNTHCQTLRAIDNPDFDAQFPQMLIITPTQIRPDINPDTARNLDV